MTPVVTLLVSSEKAVAADGRALGRICLHEARPPFFNLAERVAAIAGVGVAIVTGLDSI